MRYSYYVPDAKGVYDKELSREQEIGFNLAKPKLDRGRCSIAVRKKKKEGDDGAVRQRG